MPNIVWSFDSRTIFMIGAKKDLQLERIAGSRSLSDEEIKMAWLALEEAIALDL